MAGQLKPTCYTEGTSHSKQAPESCRIHFRYWRDYPHILVKFSTWWCGYIDIVRKITFATSFVCKALPWRPNSSIESLPNQKNWLLASQKWWGKHTRKHFRHRTVAWVELWFRFSRCKRKQLWGRWQIRSRVRQWHQGFANPRAPGCEYHTKCSSIHSANMVVNETGWKGVDDCQCNGNKEG